MRRGSLPYLIRKRPFANDVEHAHPEICREPRMKELGREPIKAILKDWNVSALDEVKTEFLKAGGDARFFAQYRNEALFGLSCIRDQLAPGMRCLEVGAGPGLLSLLLAHNGVTVDAMEPLGQGFKSFGGLLGIVQG